MKVVVRRLAPALTESEFMKIIGEEWKVGGGRVDWFSYKPGKVSTEYAPYYSTLLLNDTPILITTALPKHLGHPAHIYISSTSHT